MKTAHLFIACSSVLAMAIASTSLAWAALSCDGAGVAGDPPVFCLRKGDNVQLGYGNLNVSGVPTVTRVGEGRDLTVFGFNEDGDYIPNCYAQTLVGVTLPTVHASSSACAEEVRSFTILGKDIFT